MSVAKDTKRAKGDVVNRGYQKKCDQLVVENLRPRRTRSQMKCRSGELLSSLHTRFGGNT